MKIAFVQNVWEDNLGILGISAFLRVNGHTTKVLIEEKQMYNSLYDFSPDVLAFSCTTGLHTKTLETISNIKRNDKIKPFIVVGGPHTTYYPEFIESSGIDAICLGEGEHALLELANKMENDEDIYRIENLWVKHENGIIKNPVRPLIQDLDSLPHPDRSYYNHYSFLANNPFKIVITSRGCPYDCAFCFNHVQRKLYGEKQGRIRRRSVGHVMEELKRLQRNSGLKGVRFVDDHLTLSKKWLHDFCGQYEEEIGVPYTCNARADALDEEKVSLLKESGCRAVHFGLETGNEELRNLILGKRIKNEHIEYTVQLLKKYKIKTISYNIVGAPGETTENALETIKMNQRLNIDYPWCSVMQYYPRTRIYHYAVENGYLDPTFSLDNLGTYFDKVNTRQENRRELENVHRFFILWAKIPILMKIMKPLIKWRPNKFFDLIFLSSYAYITLRRSNMGLLRIAQIGLRSLHLFKK